MFDIIKHLEFLNICANNTATTGIMLKHNYYNVKIVYSYKITKEIIAGKGHRKDKLEKTEQKITAETSSIAILKKIKEHP